MANEQNLIPFDERTESEKREIATMGGKASGEARNKKKSLRTALEQLLNGTYNREGKDISGYDELALGVFAKASQGDVAAFNSIRDLVGEKPKDVISHESSDITGIKISFVDKSQKNTKKETDPKIVGEYTPPSNYKET